MKCVQSNPITDLHTLPLQMRQASAKQVVTQQKQQNVGYKTKVVAGVVHRTPISGVRLDIGVHLLS